MLTSFKLTILYILIIYLFKLIDNKKKYNNLVMLIMFIVIGTNYILNSISIIDLTISIIFIFLVNHVINVMNKDRSIEIITNGKVSFDNMKKANYSTSNLLKDFKKNNINSLSEVKKAVIIDNKLVISKNNYYPVPIIVSGEIDYNSLRKIGKTSFWLINNMEERNLDLKEIFYAFYYNSETYFIKKNSI